MNENDNLEFLDPVHTEEVEDIITAPPAWLLRWGISIFLGVLIVIIGLSAIIHYPDLIKTNLLINSTRSPKPIVSKISGKIVKLLVSNNEMVLKGQPLAFLESVAQPDQVLKLLTDCKEMGKIVSNSGVLNKAYFDAPAKLELGELQSSYQNFYQEYLVYCSVTEGGYYLKKKQTLLSNLHYFEEKRKKLEQQNELQQRDLNLAQEEFAVHRALTEKKVETIMELKQHESVLISKQAPLMQTQTELMTEADNISNKKQEIVENGNKIKEEREKFLQSINGLISDAQTWINKYIVSASDSGRVSFVGAIQENQIVTTGQQIFFINTGDDKFFGQINIPQENMGKVQLGQKVLIKLKSYPYEEYGILTGRLATVSDIPLKDSVYMATVTINKNSFVNLKRRFRLKYGLTGEAEIVTENASIIDRVVRSIIKMQK